MKRSTIGFILILLLTAAILAGCGEEATETTGVGMQGTTTVSQGGPATTRGGTPTTQAGTATTQAGTATTQAGTATTQGGGGGVEIPDAIAGAHTDLTPEQAKQLIDTTPGLVILDVSSRYADGHLPGAINYYFGDGSLEAALPSLDETVPYLVYCHVDSAAIAGAQALVDAGFPTVYRLQGNYAAWVEAGYPVEK